MYGEFTNTSTAVGDVPTATSSQQTTYATPTTHPHVQYTHPPQQHQSFPTYAYPYVAYPPPQVGTTTASSQYPPGPGTHQYLASSSTAPIFTTQLAAVQASSGGVYHSQYPTGTAYPTGVPSHYPSNSVPWPHQFQAPVVPGVAYPYPPSTPTPTVSHQYYDDVKSKRSRSRDKSRDRSPGHDRTSRSPRRSKTPTRRSRSPSYRKRRDERSSSDNWKRSSYSKRDRSVRRSEDGRSSSSRPLSPTTRRCERGRSPSDRKNDRNRSLERRGSDRTRSTERKLERKRSIDLKSERTRSLDRKRDKSSEISRRSEDRKYGRGHSDNHRKSTDQRDTLNSPTKRPQCSSVKKEREKSSQGRKSGDAERRKGVNNQSDFSISDTDELPEPELRNEDRGKEAKLTKESHNRNIKPRNKKKKEPVNPNNSSDPLPPLTNEEIIAAEKKIWIRSAPADLYYSRDPSNAFIMKSTDKAKQLQDQFKEKLIMPAIKARQENPTREAPRLKGHTHKHGTESSSSSSDEDDDPTFKSESQNWLEYRARESNRLHKELWQNLPNELNDGPACRCSKKSRETGIRHGIWVGEEDTPKTLDPSNNNFHDLHHYRITISPPTNFLVSIPTMIKHDEHTFLFEGFSMFTRQEIPDFPVCKIIRFNIEYTILFFKERMPENFTINELDLFSQYFFQELLELWDWKLDQRYIFMPRFARDLSEDGKELLSMNEVLHYLYKSYKPLVDAADLNFIHEMKEEKWKNFSAKMRGMLVTKPGKAPSTIRVDNLDRDDEDKSSRNRYPEIVHFGLKPSQLCYAGSAEYQKQFRDFVKFRHLLANMPKPTSKDKQTYQDMENKLMELRANSKMKRDTTVVVSSKGFYRTGLMADIVQHAMLLPVLVSHLRFHFSLIHLETRIDYKFSNRFLLQQALTHPSYKENFGTNPDHVRNTLSNCGIRQPEYGDKKVHAVNSRKRGINTLINIMSKMGRKYVTESKVKHNERLEYLGDAVVEFVTSAHLFYLFPDLEEGGLATYRSAIVLNQNLAELALALGLDKYILFSHGPDLCHDSELRHAMANCFEAFLGSIFLDGGINVADKVFNLSMFEADRELYDVWGVLPLHPLQTQEPGGDRHWIQKFPHLRKLVKFEEESGIEFNHIRLLARAFTDRSVGINNLTLGSNQRLEFLGDSVLQLVTSEFLYKHFPDHHEGHLSLLRASLVNNRTQAVVCDDLGMTKYASYSTSKPEIKVKDKADLLEAFMGALYVDKDLYYCQVFAQVCFFPRLYQFILNQDWNDPKSKLQQCCLTLRTMDGRAPDIPIYKVIECKGPSNTREYTVAVYFRGERLAKDRGHSIQQAEFNAADQALKECAHLFPHLNYQKRVLMRSFKRQGIDYLKYKNKEDAAKKSQAPAQEEKLVGPPAAFGGAKKLSKRKRMAKEERAKDKEKRHSNERRSNEGYDYYYDELYKGSLGGGGGDGGSEVRHDHYYDRDDRDSYDREYRNTDERYRNTSDTRDMYYDTLSSSAKEEKKKRKIEKGKQRDGREKRKHGRDKHKSGGISLQDDTEMISEDDNVEGDNKIEDMMKDTVAISDDEIALDKSKGSEIDNIKVEVKDEYIEEGECKDNNVIIKDLLNSAEDISADEEDLKFKKEYIEVKDEYVKDEYVKDEDKSETICDDDLPEDSISEEPATDKVEVFEEQSQQLNDQEKVEESNEIIKESTIIDENDAPNDQLQQASDKHSLSTQNDESTFLPHEDTKTADPVSPIPPIPLESNYEKEDEAPPPPPAPVESPVPPPSQDSEKSESKDKRKEKKGKSKSDRVKNEIEEIERKLAKKKAKAEKLAEKERKKKEKIEQSKKEKIAKEKSREDELNQNDKQSEDKQNIDVENISHTADLECNDKVKPINEETEETKKISNSKTEECKEVAESKSITGNTNDVNVSSDNNDKQDIDGEDDLEEGECSDDEDDILPPPAPAPAPPTLAPHHNHHPPTQSKSDPAKQKTSSIKPFKIQDRKELHKDKSEKKEVKELTDKEKEREEKKKRWRKESPKKSAHHKDRDYREERHRRGSHRSPSPRQRCSSRERSRYYDYDRRHTSSSATSGYYDYPATASRASSPSQSYYDYYERGSSSRSARSPRSSRRRSSRSPSRSRNSYEGSSRESKDYRY